MHFACTQVHFAWSTKTLAMEQEKVAVYIVQVGGRTVLKYTERTLNKGEGVRRQDGRGELVTIHNWRVHYRCNVAVCAVACAFGYTSGARRGMP